MIEKGIFTISLDFELYWGMRDKVTLDNYSENLSGAEISISEMLKSFVKYDIHATWATVGFLFFNNKKELENNLPTSQPSYNKEQFNPYKYIKKSDTLEQKYHFAPNSVDCIVNTKNQEIATHTMSHYYCLENGQIKQEFYDDLKKAIEIISNKTNNNTYSLVFPRNQWNDDYLAVLSELKILGYRGNEKSWIYKAVNQEDENKVRRAVRLLDAYFNISGHNTYTLKELSLEQPYNIPSSRFLRPYSKKLSFMEGIRLRRIKNSMTYAAKNNELFHLWWHPHNFGKDISSNISILNKILEHYKTLEHEYGMKSLNMKEVSNLLQEQQ
jgi:peptidoglycan/xylan/chitin deacetylase (PgdA/CDA1 family)